MEFEEPMRLALIVLIPILIYLHLISLRMKKDAAFRFGNFETLKKATKGALPYNTYIPLAIRSLALLFLIIAIAGPQSLTKVETSGTDVVLAIDVSGSMQATDYIPSRLDAAKVAAMNFVRQMKSGDRVGVVTFSGASHIISPILGDYEKITDAVSTISIGIEDGTAMGEGLVTSVSLLGGSGGRKKVVVLLSDGVNNRGVLPDHASRYSEETDVVVYTIGVGSNEGALIPGTVEVAGLDEDILKKIAGSTGGKYYKASSEEALKDIYSDIVEKITYEERAHELSNYFVYAGAFLLLLEFILTSIKYRALP